MGGSQRYFIREDVSRTLGLQELGKTSLRLNTFGQSTSAIRECRLVEVVVRSQYSDELFSMEAIEVPFICKDVVQVPLESDFVLSIEAAGQPIADKLLHPGMLAVPGISLLLGADHLWKVMTGEVRRHPRNSRLVALNSIFGWMFQGPLSLVSSLDVTSNICVLRVNSTQEPVGEELERFWSLESIGISDQKQEPADEVQTILAQFKRNLAFVNGRYEVALPWKLSTEQLEDNRSQAIKRLKSLGLRLSRNPEFAVEYDTTIRNYMNMGHAEKVPLDSNAHNVYYMPHHAVIRSDSTTTKVRVVFDASSHRPGATSLNDHLEKGPKLVADLVKLLIRFRLYRVAMTADIEKAFLQISVRKEDRDALRFLWFRRLPKKDEPEPEIEEYRMTRVPFGTKASPFLLNATLQHHLKTVEGPLAGTADLLSQSFYVDDLLVGAPQDREAVNLFYEANDMIGAAGMKLRKWASNSEYLRKLFSAHEGSVSSEAVKILGLLWNPEKDLITVATKAIQGLSEMKSNCKRYVLQVVARIFDPLGLLAPFTVGAKFIFQELWQRGVGWDDDLPSDLEKQWKNWRYELPQLGGITVDRCIVVDQHSKSVQLHVFCDASQRAYGACAYLRVDDSKGHVRSSLVFSKSRIAPLKTMTLPRLELMAALLGSRIATFLKDCFYGLLEVSQIVYWTDSLITLHWLRGNQAQWNEFVRNRVAEVQSCTDKTQWRHCPGYANPADRLTRGTSLNHLSTDNLWWSGPSWLVKGNHDWPADTQNSVLVPSELCLELKKEVKILHVAVLKPILELSRYSRLGRVLRVTAWVFRFIAKARGANTTTFSTITGEEITTAEVYWIKTVQEESYGEEIAQLQLGNHVDKQSKTSKFDPMLDSTGCLRVGGRLHFSEEAPEVKHPILLPPQSPFTELVITDAHLRTLHGGTNDTLAELRERYWIPRGRQLVKKVVNRCTICMRARLRPATAPTAPLPSDRVCRSDPFQIVGIDFAGPLFVKQEKSFAKAYVALFTCAVTRAVHLELVSGLSTEIFLLAFRRFTARRGIPTVIYTDNAQTFKKAAKEIRVWENILFDRMFQEHCADRRIKWKFIVERAAWWGGFWERMIRTVKVSLRKVLSTAKLSFEELTTLLSEVESVVNSRPLTHLATTPEEWNVLTPAHFLVGKRLTALPSSHSATSPFTGVTRRWKHRQKILDHFWNRWRKEYLLSLRSAHSSNSSQSSQVHAGDVVLVQEDKAPRHMWKMGRVLEVYPGRDNVVRACTVKLPNGATLRRPVQLLYPMEVVD